MTSRIRILDFVLMLLTIQSMSAIVPHPNDLLPKDGEIGADANAPILTTANSSAIPPRQISSPSNAVRCIANAPYFIKPNVGDCSRLHQALLLDRQGRVQKTYVERSFPHAPDPNIVTVPHSYAEGTCRATVNTQHSHKYDKASLSDIANLVSQLVYQCFGPDVRILYDAAKGSAGTVGECRVERNVSDTGLTRASKPRPQDKIRKSRQPRIADWTPLPTQHLPSSMWNALRVRVTFTLARRVGA